MTEEDIIFEQQSGEGGSLGIIRLNRPKALNALTLDMCIDLHDCLAKWAIDDAIKAVIIRGEGDRAFCAGGDVRKLYENRGQISEADIPFFWYEYRMNAAIYHFPKPYIAFLDGITMGGGAGVSIHGSHRVATERLRFAMPETGIGFFPDIGASHFLTRCPGKTGWYLGLTGNSIGYADAQALGLATHCVSSTSIDALQQRLLETKFSANDNATVSAIINQFAMPVVVGELAPARANIDFCFAQNSIIDVVDALQQANTPWCQDTANTLLACCPTSLCVTFEQLHRASILNFDHVMQMEYNIAQSFLKDDNFYEGIRAALIDKDRNPKWSPASLKEVDPRKIASFFSAKGQMLLEA